MRISYIGGGTDYPEYFKDSPGGVISSAIDKYVYVYSNPLSDIAEENYRFTYRESESVKDYSEFKHPVVREMLKYLNWSSRMNMGTFADLPSGIGLGGSSAFSVAMCKLLELENTIVSNSHFAELAIHIEREVLKEPGGYQDQYASAFGGLRSYDFFGDAEPIVSSCLLNEGNAIYLEERQMLIWVGETRNSSLHSMATVQSIKSKRTLLQETHEVFLSTKAALANSVGNSSEIFKLLSTAVKSSWDLKQSFTTKQVESVNEVIKIVIKSGIQSFKLCGAGGSGFILVLGEPDELNNLRHNLFGYKTFQPKIDMDGCKQLL